MVVGNKADLEKFRKVSKATAEDYARNIGALGYVEASAKVPSPWLLSIQTPSPSLSRFLLLFTANTLCCSIRRWRLFVIDHRHLHVVCRVVSCVYDECVHGQTGDGIEEIFMNIAHKLNEKRLASPDGMDSSRSPSGGRRLVDDGEGDTGRRCCT